MSGYLARLKSLIRENRPAAELTELPKGTEGASNGTCVSFVSNATGRFASTVHDAHDHGNIGERAGLAADRVPTAYLDAWARLNHRKPARVSEAEWRLALDDGGRFLDAWGSEGAEGGWIPSDLFEVSAGLVWKLAGACVEALGPDHARLSDGRIVRRSEMKGGA
jgi:hypothetical protein